MIKEDRRDKLIQSCVTGKSFVDVGPLWLTQNQKLSVAHLAGAKSVAALDQFPSDSEWWKKLRDVVDFDYEEISSNLMDFEGKFDVTYCSGVIYHFPSPLECLRKLREITNETLILCSVYVEKYLTCEVGALEVPSMLFLPSLSHDEFLVVKNTIGKKFPPNTWGITEEIPASQWNLNTWYWWWLFTIDSLRGMAQVCNFSIEEEVVQKDTNLVTFKLRKY